MRMRFNSFSGYCYAFQRVSFRPILTTYLPPLYPLTEYSWTGYGRRHQSLARQNSYISTYATEVRLSILFVFLIFCSCRLNALLDLKGLYNLARFTLFPRYFEGAHLQHRRAKVPHILAGYRAYRHHSTLPLGLNSD